MSALERQKQEDLWEFEASLFYRVNSRTSLKGTEETLYWKNKPKKKVRRFPGWPQLLVQKGSFHQTDSQEFGELFQQNDENLEYFDSLNITK